jgi:hypothetical protein
MLGVHNRVAADAVRILVWIQRLPATAEHERYAASPWLGQ